MNEAKQKFCLTSLERAWILYDVGNSAFVLLVATLIPIFFNALAEEGGLSSVEYLAYWGYIIIFSESSSFSFTSFFCA